MTPKLTYDYNSQVGFKHADDSHMKALGDVTAIAKLTGNFNYILNDANSNDTYAKLDQKWLDTRTGCVHIYSAKTSMIEFLTCEFQ
tara:strand:- start:226 stop:483 length:258 start_codon:yes stop_codon:yes gene_type:complete